MIPLKNNEQAVEILVHGGVGVLATDTLYGIVARAADPKAVARMYALKQRERKPGTVIAANVEQLIELGVDAQYLERVKKWWPGALSVETPLGPHLAYLHQETGRQGFRVVADPRVRGILMQTGPLVTSSANQPGEEPAASIDDAYGYFGDSVDFYVDSGDRSNSKPSTIARVTDKGIEIIRQGAVTIPPNELIPAPQPGDCPFCLGNGLLKTPIVYENAGLYLTTPSDKPGTYLIIPKLHTEELLALPDAWWALVKDALSHVPAPMDAYNFSLNYGRAAGQTIQHLHFWIVPRSHTAPSAGKGIATLVLEADRAAA